jgi:dTDP-4-dehydrorhamnose 3,5-epimerase
MSGMSGVGIRDSQTVVAGGGRAASPQIGGVRIFELGNVLTRSGWMAEVFRSDWPLGDVTVRQINWVELNPGAVTDWHCHHVQTDHLIGVGGIIKLALWDGRETSSTLGASEIIRLGAMRPVMVAVPAGVWHGLRNEAGVPAGYLNIIDQLYMHAEPDNWRAAPGDSEIPNIL